MRHCRRRGCHAFLRGYFHYKSADWPGNRPHKLAVVARRGAGQDCRRYYIMGLDRTMPETVAAEMPSAGQVAACAWLPDRELAVYAARVRRAPAFRAG